MNSAQSGSAVQIYPTADSNLFVRYFWNSTGNSVQRLVNSNSVATTMANNVTNSLIFSAQNFAGTVLTNNQNNRVISMMLQFFQVDYPAGQSGSTKSDNFYQ